MVILSNRTEIQPESWYWGAVTPARSYSTIMDILIISVRYRGRQLQRQILSPENLEIS